MQLLLTTHYSPMTNKMDFRKKINMIFFTSLIVVPFTVFGVIRWVNNNYTTLPYYGSKDTQRASSKEKNFTVPSFYFTNQSNLALTDGFVEDKIWVADYFFTKCTSICPKLSSHLEKVQEAFKD